MAKKGTRFPVQHHQQLQDDSSFNQEQEKAEGILSGLEAFIEEGWEKKRKRKGDLGARELQQRWERFSSALEREGGHPETAARRKGRLGRSSFLAAAAAAAVLAIVLVVNRHSPTPPLPGKFHSKLTVVRSGAGERKHFMLPDGTAIWLNEGSSLSWTKDFGTENRRVRLEGEGFFEVVSDAVRPFTVETDKITVRVLGTSFNIKDYEGDDNVQTTLISGSIQVSLNSDTKKKILLSPREKLTVMKETIARHINQENARLKSLKYEVQALVPLSPADSNAIPETAWMDDKIIFVDEPFGEVAKKMERHYHVHIHFRDEHLKQITMRGEFDKESIDQALGILQMITPFRYDRRGDTLYLYP